MEFEKLQEIIVDVLNVNPDEITMDTTFVDDLGADSLDIFQIIMGIEEAFDIEIANEDAESIVTVGDAVEPVSYTHLDVYKRQIQISAVNVFLNHIFGSFGCERGRNKLCDQRDTAFLFQE